MQASLLLRENQSIFVRIRTAVLLMPDYVRQKRLNIVFPTIFPSTPQIYRKSIDFICCLYDSFIVVCADPSENSDHSNFSDTSKH